MRFPETISVPIIAGVGPVAGSGRSLKAAVGTIRAACARDRMSGTNRTHTDSHLVRREKMPPKTPWR
jgi:hypothetical protein